MAENHKTAHATAEIDWNWQHVGPNEWLDHEGERVRYVDHREALMGLARGTIVYQGYNYYRHRDYHEFDAIIRARGYEERKPADWAPNSLPPKP
ncbi:MAG: hypothetical protein KGL39_57165 [Patescibacteria group bacterium]|nr:hypothetical protein [Patescibacteria group bacterium]